MLNTKKNIAKQDDFMEELLAAHEGLSKSESDAFNARLILLLANHIGDLEVLRAALEAAGDSGGSRAE
jgi:predicted LPLAT superfamily acyltransferase